MSQSAIDQLPDLDRLIEAAEAAADAAGAVIRPYFRAGVATDTKPDQSPVTIADRGAEQALRAVLGERFPNHGIHGEEFGEHNTGAALCWVLDPIDGTRAFITGRLAFGTLIALLHDGQPVLGVIDQPITGERWIGAAGRPTVFRGPFGGRAGCRMHLGDWAALVPVIEGAGGRLTDWHGRKLTPDSDGHTLAVGDPVLLAQAIEILAA